MSSSLYSEDPNQYIQSLSQVRRNIQKKISPSLSSESKKISNEIDRQISQNIDKYKKNILIRQRLTLLKEQQQVTEKKRKENLQQMIESKIKMSQQVRQKKKQQIIESNKMQRLLKQAINHEKKQEIRKNNLLKSLQLIQRIQKKMADPPKIPIRLRLLEEQLKDSRSKRYQNTTTSLNNRVSSEIFRSNVNSLLSLKKNQDQAQSLNLMLTQPEYISERVPFEADKIFELMRKNHSIKRAKSLLNLSSHKPLSKSNQQKILEKLIQQKQKEEYNKYLSKNSLSYKASNHSRVKDVKNAIQSFLQESYA